MAQSSFGGFVQPRKDGGKGGYKGLTIPFSESKEPPLFATYGTIPYSPYFAFSKNGVTDGTYIYFIFFNGVSTYSLYKCDKFGNLITSSVITNLSNYSGIYYNKIRNTLLLYHSGGFTNATYPALEVNTTTLATTNISSLFNVSPLNIGGSFVYMNSDGKGNVFVTQQPSINTIYVSKLSLSDYSLSTTVSSSSYLTWSYSNGQNVHYSAINDGLYICGSTGSGIYVVPYYASSNSFGSSFTFSPGTAQATNHSVDSEGRLILVAKNTSTGYRVINYYNPNNTLLQSYSDTSSVYTNSWIAVFKNNFLIFEPVTSQNTRDLYTKIIDNKTGNLTNKNSMQIPFYGNTAPREDMINGINITFGVPSSSQGFITTFIEQLSY